MTDWFQMPVHAKKIADSLVQFNCGSDVIEMHICLNSSYFNELQTRVVNHYIRTPNNKVQNSLRTSALCNRIHAFLLSKYLEELKNVFCDIAAEPEGKLNKTFSCLGWNFNQYSTPEEVFLWFYNRYNYHKDFSEVIEPLKENEGFLQKEICDYLLY